jgi:hypothetical protein
MPSQLVATVIDFPRTCRKTFLARDAEGGCGRHAGDSEQQRVSSIVVDLISKVRGASRSNRLTSMSTLPPKADIRQ